MQITIKKKSPSTWVPLPAPGGPSKIPLTPVLPFYLLQFNGRKKKKKKKKNVRTIIRDRKSEIIDAI